jgi:hypothetical protein
LRFSLYGLRLKSQNLGYGYFRQLVIGEQEVEESLSTQGGMDTPCIVEQDIGSEVEKEFP